MRCFINLLVAFSLVAGAANAAISTPVQFLVDWSTNSIDSLKIDSVIYWTRLYSTSPGIGLTRTADFAAPVSVNNSVPDSIPVPRFLDRAWYTLSFNQDEYIRNEPLTIRSFGVGFSHSVRTDSTGKVEIVTMSRGMRTEVSLSALGDPGRFSLQRCIDSLRPDTLWIRANACYDHNPFLGKGVAVRFLPPLPVRELRVIVNGASHRMTPLSDPSSLWYGKTLGYPPDSVDTRKDIRFVGIDYLGAEHLWDSAGSVWHTNLANGDSAWYDMHGLLSNWRPMPALRIMLPEGDRLMLDGQPWLQSGLTVLPGWTEVDIWSRPRSVQVVHPNGQRSSELTIPSTNGTFWVDGNGIGARPAAWRKDPVATSVSAFDFDQSYGPFSEREQCWDKTGARETRGLVRQVLDSAGLPVWSGLRACSITSDLEGPGHWFRPGIALLDTTIQLAMNFDSTKRSLNYKNYAFFPLDRASSAPPPDPSGNRQHNFGFCVHADLEVLKTPGGLIEVGGDDDIWLFVDDTLRVDLGGIHAPFFGKFELDRVDGPPGRPIDLDLFQCERMRSGSAISFSSNVPLFSSGTFHRKDSVTASLQTGVQHKVMQMIDSRSKLHLDFEPNIGWNLSLRSLDGRNLSSWSGIGSSRIDLARWKGLLVLELRTKEQLQTKRIFLR